MSLNRDVLFTIWTFLDHPNRLVWNESMPNDLKFVKKIKGQESHQLHIQTSLCITWMKNANESSDLLQKIKLYSKLFTYLLQSKDTCVLTHLHPNYPRILIAKCKEFTKPYFLEKNLYNRYPKQIRKLIRNCKKLIRKIESTPFVKQVPIQRWGTMEGSL